MNAETASTTTVGRININFSSYKIPTVINLSRTVFLGTPLKLKCYKKLVKEMYFAVAHWEMAPSQHEDHDGWYTVHALTRAHGCGVRCEKEIKSVIEFIREIIKANDFLIFLFAFDKFCQDAMGDTFFGSMRKTILTHLFPLVINECKPDEEEEFDFYATYYGCYENTQFFKNLNTVYMNTVGKFSLITQKWVACDCHHVVGCIRCKTNIRRIDKSTSILNNIKYMCNPDSHDYLEIKNSTTKFIESCLNY